jgi:hypothetical protein
MAHTVLLKRSTTTTAAPTAGQLAAGELAINTVDEKIFFKNSSGTVKSLSSMSDLTSNLVTLATTQTISGIKTFSSAVDFQSKVSASGTTDTLDVLASTDGSGLRIAQATSGAGSRVGGIRLGRSPTAGHNTYIQNSSGILSFYNGVDAAGTLLFTADTSGFAFSFGLSADSIAATTSGTMRTLYLRDTGFLTAGLRAPTTLTNAHIYTLPAAVGAANQVLTISSVAGNDATLSWATVSGAAGPTGPAGASTSDVHYLLFQAGVI